MKGNEKPTLGRFSDSLEMASTRVGAVMSFFAESEVVASKRTTGSASKLEEDTVPGIFAELIGP